MKLRWKEENPNLPLTPVITKRLSASKAGQCSFDEFFESMYVISLLIGKTTLVGVSAKRFLFSIRHYYSPEIVAI